MLSNAYIIFISQEDIIMTFKQFKRWCKKRESDGYWSRHEKEYCIDLINTIKEFPFWMRGLMWEEKYEHNAIKLVVEPVNKLIAMYEADGCMDAIYDKLK